MLVCSVDNFRLVRINKPANLCVVVSRIEVVEARFGIVVVTAIAEWVIRAESRSKRTGHGKNVATRVIFIRNNGLSRGVQYWNYVSLKISSEEIIVAAVTKSDNRACFVVIEQYLFAVPFFSDYRWACKNIRGRYSVDGLLLCKNLYNQNATPRKFLFNPNPFSAFFFFLFLIIFSWFF